jgi:ribosomal protein L14
MHLLLALMLALQSATVVAVLDNQEVTLALQVGDVIYTAEFSRHALRPETFNDGDHVAAEVRDGKMRVKRKDGKTVSGRVIWEQRVLVHPIPEH